MTATIAELETESATADRSDKDFTSPYAFDFTRSAEKIEVRAMVPMIGPILMGTFWDGGSAVAPGGSGRLLAIAEGQWRSLNAPKPWNP